MPFYSKNHFIYSHIYLKILFIKKFYFESLRLDEDDEDSEEYRLLFLCLLNIFYLIFKIFFFLKKFSFFFNFTLEDLQVYYDIHLPYLLLFQF